MRQPPALIEIIAVMILSLAVTVAAVMMVRAAPAPLPLRQQKAVEEHPAWLCGTWRLGWGTSDNAPFWMRLDIDGTYLCGHGGGKVVWIGRWRLHAGLVIVSERADYEQAPRTFAVRLDGVKEKVPDGFDHAGTTVWMARPTSVTD